MTKYQIGDKVRREININDPSKGYKYGKIIKIYSKEATYYPFSKITLGPYKELYKVKWDNGIIENGFLPHGIDKI